MTDKLKTTLINAGKILYSEQQGDDIFGDVTVRLPDDTGHFLMKPHTFGLEEITLENIITVNLDGEKTAGSAPRHLEVFIHSEILRARSDVQAVVHNRSDRRGRSLRSGRDRDAWRRSAWDIEGPE